MLLMGSKLTESRRQIGILVTRVNEAADAQQVRHLALVPGVVGIAA
jgi:hypothetical protein